MADASTGSPPDTSKLTTILIKDLPEELNKRDTLLEHFSQFGEVTRVQCRSDCTAIVHFKQHGDALAAKNKGKKISPQFRPVGIQWCRMGRQSSSEGTNLTGASLPKSSSAHSFQANNTSKSNPFQMKKSTVALLNSPSEQANLFASSASTSSDNGSDAGGSEKRATFGSARDLFGKKSLDSNSAQAGATLFGKALEKAKETVKDLPASNAGPSSLSTSSFETRVDNPFAKLPDTPQISEGRLSGGSLASKEPAKPTAPSGSIPPAGTSPVFRLGGLFGKSGSEKQALQEPRTSTTASLANTENTKDGFVALPGSAAPLTAGVFRKATLPMNIPTTSAPASMGLFGKPTSPSTASGSEAVSCVGPVAKPSMLFGKPFTGDTSQKPGSSLEPKGTLSDKQPPEGGTFAPAFKARGASSEAVLPSFSVMRWSADGASKDLTSRTPFGAKQDAPRPRTNLVWTKDKADTSSRGSLSVPTKKTMNPADLQEAPAPLAAPKQLSVVTRSNTRSASPSKFAELFTHAAHSVGDRYKLLEMRDKIIRELISSEVQKGPIKGTCTDMCPEKERYQRSQRNLVEKFEMLPGADGVMDHTRMIKEYQRSSADQEFPLPHELRPPHILKMTMNFLIREIISNQPNKGCGDWFSFVWNRTRAIRKDITQQKIEADPISALILERCARFHIHCSHSLCEEDSHDFDSKLNKENLTKCLKSLKYSYADLKVQNVRCPNEAEFVAYEILLNLKEGFIAKMITDLEPELRRNALVRLSIAAMNAFESGNYRRFFKIVRQAPYLAACILHCYFIEVRRHALFVLSKSLSSKGGDITLSTLTSELLFNSKEECSSFLAILNIEPDENGFINCKTMVDHDDLRFSMSRSLDIMRRMDTSLAQIVYGAGTIPLDNYTPEDSFTADGMLKKSALGLLEDYKLREPQQAPLFASVQVPERPKRIELRDENLLPALLSVIEYVQQEQVNAICREVALEQSISLINLGRIVETIIYEEVRSAANEIFEQEKTADIMRQRALQSKIAHDVSSELVLAYSRQFLREICQKALVEVNLEVVGELASENQQRILSGLLADLVLEVASLEYEAQIDENNTQLADNFRTMILCKRSIKKWRKWVWLHKEIRDFPAAPNLGPIKPYPHTGKSYAEIRAEQVRLTAMRLLAGIKEKADTLPLNLPNLFKKRVRILVVGDVPKVISDKVKRLLCVDSTVSYQSGIPDSVQGFNVIVVLSSGSPANVSAIAGAAQRLKPKPAVGILWCAHPVLLSLDVDEELLQRNHEPVCIPLCNLLKKLSRRVSEEVRLQRASLPDFIDRGMEFCLHKLSTPCNYLPAAVRLYNEIVVHLAAVATSSALLQINSLDDENGWNGKAQLCTLYNRIKNLELPLPKSNDRAAFVETVQRVKGISLLTTAINMADFKDDFVLLRDILARFNYTLDPFLKVRYLEDDLRNFEIPDFWYRRPVTQNSRSTTPLEQSARTESESGQEEEVENYRDRLDETIRSAREVLRRSELSNGRRVLKVCDLRNLKRPLETQDPQPEVIRKKRSDGSSKDPSTKMSSANSLKQPPTGRLSKQTKIELDLFEVKRAIEMLKSKARIKRLLRDA
ncbi:uncharacterized protein LOC111268761 [Varroa jacobsoni]|uniref:uncharacterized protein LOC111268761 n=1 Tax=Varroa jacobsoni TaxID=62625 RepID=UPI000BF44C51|nr:uncharacterized protein LOC111268761 [Varroa jacobsoni]XP_022703661.1 uncharacterized protein LOC111268761 [Varroa jacobsoni]